MPIRINLLAEAQAMEDMRRRDPVKRAIWIGAVCVALMLAWSGTLAFRALAIRSEVSKLEGRAKAQEKDWQSAQVDVDKTRKIRQKLASLQLLASNRFLSANLMNALQLIYVDDVQLTHIKTEQSFQTTDEVKPSTSGGQAIPGRPATSTEHLVLTIEAKDSSPIPGTAVTKYRTAIANFPYFETGLGKKNEVVLKDLGPPVSTPDSKPYREFTLECRFPDKTR